MIVMKKVLAVLFVFGAITVTLLAVIDLEPYLNNHKGTKSLPPIPVNQERITDANSKAASSSPMGDRALTPTSIPQKPAQLHLPTQNNPPAASEVISSAADRGEKSEVPVLSVATDSSRQVAGEKATPVAALSAPEPSGLLTDTTETSENSILHPNAAQVNATSPKTPEKPSTVSQKKVPISLEIAAIANGSHPYSILLDTLDESSSAQQAVALYRNKGIAAYWVKVDLGKTGLKYRLFTGMFDNEGSAGSFIAQQKLSGKLIKNTPYAAHIGTFHDKKELAKAYIKSAEAGTCPYILGKENGPFVLFVGAFYTLEGAENQCRELLTKNVPCKARQRATPLPK